MATHSSILAWRIPWMEELGGLQSMGHKESDTTERLYFHFHFYMRAEEQASFSLFRCDIFFCCCCYSWILIFLWWVLRTHSGPMSDSCPKDQKSTHIKPGYTDHFNVFTNLLHISHLRTLLHESGLRSPYVWTFSICQGFISIYLQRLNCS